MKKQAYGLLAVSALLFSCATQGAVNAPLWVRDREAAYPNGEWLCAVETAANKSAAEAAALAALAQSFRMDVAAVVRAGETYVSRIQQTGGTGIAASAEFRSVAREVSAVSSVSGLSGVEREYWAAPNGEVWALARMNRAEAAARYSAAIAEHEKLIALLRETAAARSGIDAWAALASAADAAALADNWYAMRSVLRPETAGTVPAYGGEASLRATMREAARGVAIDLRVGGTGGVRAATAFAEVFTSRGFRTGAGSPYVLQALSALEDTDQSGGGFVYARWNVSAVLADSAGAELFAWSDTGREGHTSRPEARERALRKTEAVISAGFAEAFDAWAASRL
ncbi:MAG: hypothetical protein LBC88_01495 [Spirochaetaceae bacterium]|nr:hypothetical protein [Spirochaetaceae bacterium]